ncbi:MAG TPA: hypothetical protein PKL99_02160 [Syntrophales bacterium]|nr:hypothetical protein [Syntrophales bacterium]
MASLAGGMKKIFPLAMGCLMVLFTLMEFLPRLRDLTFDRRYLFGGLRGVPPGHPGSG